MNCPYCYHKLDKHTSADFDKAKPAFNDLTICIGCTRFLKFNKDLIPVRLSFFEIIRLRFDNPDLFKHLHIIRSTIKDAKKQFKNKI